MFVSSQLVDTSSALVLFKLDFASPTGNFGINVSNESNANFQTIRSRMNSAKVFFFAYYILLCSPLFGSDWTSQINKDNK